LFVDYEEAVRTMSLTLKNIIVNTCYYLITAVLLPAGVLSIEQRLGVGDYRSVPLGSFAIIVGLVGAILQARCIMLFHREGRGTPSPAFPPQRLVTTGPYAWVRNPMNWGELLVFLGLAGWFGSPLLAAYAAFAWIAFHAFIVAWEEPRLSTTFRADYDRYRSAVPRWRPKKPISDDDRSNRA
jgi:protein-S-isoprenylcysteine O-methyltransferase Ste14